MEKTGVLYFQLWLQIPRGWPLSQRTVLRIIFLANVMDLYPVSTDHLDWPSCCIEVGLARQFLLQVIWSQMFWSVGWATLLKRRWRRVIFFAKDQGLSHCKLSVSSGLASLLQRGRFRKAMFFLKSFLGMLTYHLLVPKSIELLCVTVRAYFHSSARWSTN